MVLGLKNGLHVTDGLCLPQLLSHVLLCLNLLSRFDIPSCVYMQYYVFGDLMTALAAQPPPSHAPDSTCL